MKINRPLLEIFFISENTSQISRLIREYGNIKGSDYQNGITMLRVLWNSHTAYELARVEIQNIYGVRTW